MPLELLTIICINLNSNKGLERTLASLSRQRFEDFSVLVQDGLSIDDSLNAVDNYGSLRIRVEREKDLGIADAFNKAISNSTSEWVLFLNAGDEFVDSAVLENLSDILRTTDADVVFGPFYVRHYDGSLKRRDVSLSKLKSGENSINHQSAFIRRETHQSFAYDIRLPLGMDYDLWLRMIDFGCKFQKVETAIAVFHIGGRSSSLKFSGESLLWHHMIRTLNGSTSFRVRSLIWLLVRVMMKRASYCFALIFGERRWHRIKSVFKPKDRESSLSQ